MPQTQEISPFRGLTAAPVEMTEGVLRFAAGGGGDTATGSHAGGDGVGNAGTLEPLHTVPVSEATPAFAAWTEAEI